MVSVGHPAIDRRPSQPVQHQRKVRGLGRRQVSTVGRVSRTVKYYYCQWKNFNIYNIYTIPNRIMRKCEND